MRYPRAFEPNTSHANAVSLLDKAEIRQGVLLDLGCGNAPAAEPLAERGFDYVGLDLDRASLRGLHERGFENHRVDLGVSPSRLDKKLREIVGDRSLSVVFALDVLEHVVDPRGVVEVLASLASEHEGCSLVVSIPNVTHRDVAARLLLGQWTMTEVGLLDDTHLRFFSPAGFAALFHGTGWRVVDELDTSAEVTEQLTLLRTPALQPGAPVGDFLRRLRARVDDHATTYQFVRRLVLDPDGARAIAEPPAPSCFLSVLVLGDLDETAPLRADLDGQTDGDLEVVALGEEATYDDVNRALDRIRGRYLAVLHPDGRVGPGYVAALRRGAGDPADGLSTDCVVRLDCVGLPAARLDGAPPFAELVEGAVPFDPDGFDLLRSDLQGNTALAAYAVPRSALQSLGVRFRPELAEAAPAVFLAEVVELCSLRGIGAVEVAVPEEHVRPATLDAEAVRDGIGPRAFLLPPGGVARLAHQRKTLIDSVTAERSMRAELEDLRPRAIEAERERDRLDAELTAVVNTKLWRWGQGVRRVYAWARRRAGALLRR